MLECSCPYPDPKAKDVHRGCPIHGDEPIAELTGLCVQRGLGFWMGYDPQKQTPALRFEVRVWDSDAELRVRTTAATLGVAAGGALARIVSDRGQTAVIDRDVSER